MTIEHEFAISHVDENNASVLNSVDMVLFGFVQSTDVWICLWNVLGCGDLDHR